MLTIKIGTGNSAFDDDAGRECARMLRELATTLERGTRKGRLADINGNTCGEFTLTKGGRS